MSPRLYFNLADLVKMANEIPPPPESLEWVVRDEHQIPDHTLQTLRSAGVRIRYSEYMPPGIGVQLNHSIIDKRTASIEEWSKGIVIIDLKGVL